MKSYWKSIFLVLIVNAFGISANCQQDDEAYQKVKLKVDKKLADHKYYSAYKLSSIALRKYADDPYFHYTSAFSLYYSEKNKKVKQKYPGKEELTYATFELLQKSKPLTEFNKGFSTKFQRGTYKLLTHSFKDNDIDKAFMLLDALFGIFDGSETFLVNANQSVIQDTLFNRGKKAYLNEEFALADRYFNWMDAIYSNGNFATHYDASALYFSEKYAFEKYKNPKYFLAHTAADAGYLDKEEKLVIFIHNLVRMDPKLFNATFIQTYFDENESFHSHENGKSLRATLKDMKRSQLLYPNEKLYEAAKYHAKDMGAEGTTGHHSSDGTQCGDRLIKFGSKGTWAENCDYGYEDPLKIVMRLLLDIGVSSLGHRKTILNNRYSVVGVSTQAHKRWDYNTVLDYNP